MGHTYPTLVNECESNPCDTEDACYDPDTSVFFNYECEHPTKRCPDGYTRQISDQCYRVLDAPAEGFKWDEALAACAATAAGASLASVHDMQEAVIVQALWRASGGGDTWVGANDKADEGTFTFPDDQAVADLASVIDGVTVIPWKYGHPAAQSSAEDCVKISGASLFGPWVDVFCNETLPHAVCLAPATDDPSANTAEAPRTTLPDGSSPAVEVDTDGDGYPDCVDECPRDNGLITDADSDGDGILDCNECRPSTTDPLTCFRYQSIQATYLEAVADCELQGGKLAIPDSVAEDGTVWWEARHMVGPEQALWVGVDRLVDGTWRHVTGNDVTRPWISGQPDGPSQCAALSETNDWQGRILGWRNYPCDTQLPYVCQFRPDTCINGYVALNGQCVGLIDEPKAWFDAGSTCDTLGMDMLSVHDSATETLVRRIAGDRFVWLGATNYGSLQWHDESSTNYQAWMGGQPDNYGVQDCVTASGSGWDDQYCAQKLPFLCAFPDACPDATGPCLNGGRCASSPDGLLCHCPYGLGGTRCEDLCGFDPLKTEPGVCGCGVEDIDSDGDFVLDCHDLCPFNVNKTTDIDSDGDGVLDCNDACPTDATLAEFSIDSDGDGVLDCNDECPNDATKVVSADRDGDGVVDCVDDCPDDPVLWYSPDPDGDDFPSCVDNCPFSGIKQEPGLCGCDHADSPENLADDDGDFVVNCIDECPLDVDKSLPGSCGCGVADTDSDGDGVPDCIDECPADSTKTLLGLCGCSQDDVDSDGDGSPDCVDACTGDPGKIAPGLCGCGTPEGSCGASQAALVVGGVPTTAGTAAVVAGVSATTAASGDDDAFVVVVHSGSGEVEQVLTTGGPGKDAWLAAATNDGITATDNQAVLLAGRTTARPASLGLGAGSAASQEAMAALHTSLDDMLAGLPHRWAASFGHATDAVHAEFVASAIAADGAMAPIAVLLGSYASGSLQVGGTVLPHGGSGSVFASGLASADGSAVWAVVMHDASATGVAASVAGPAAAIAVGDTLLACFNTDAGDAFVTALNPSTGAELWRTHYAPGTCTGLTAGPHGQVVVSGQATLPLVVNGVVAHDVPASTAQQGLVMRLSISTGARVFSETFGGDASVQPQPRTVAGDPSEAGSHAIVAGSAVGQMKFGLARGSASPLPRSGDVTAADAFVARFSSPSVDPTTTAWYRDGGAGDEYAQAATRVGDAMAVAGFVVSTASAEARVGRATVAPHSGTVAALRWVSLANGAAFGEAVTSEWGVTGDAEWTSVTQLTDDLVLCAGHFTTAST